MKIHNCKKRGHCYLCYADILPYTQYLNIKLNNKFVRLCMFCNSKGEDYIKDLLQKRIIEWSLKKKFKETEFVK